MKETGKKGKSIGVLIFLLCGDIVAVPLLIIYYIFWLMLAIPSANPMRLLGIARLVFCNYLCSVYSNQTGIGYEYQIRKYITNTFSETAWCIFDFTSVTLLVIMFVSAILTMSGIFTSQSYTNEKDLEFYNEHKKYFK